MKNTDNKLSKADAERVERLTALLTADTDAQTAAVLRKAIDDHAYLCKRAIANSRKA